MKWVTIEDYIINNCRFAYNSRILYSFLQFTIYQTIYIYGLLMDKSEIKNCYSEVVNRIKGLTIEDYLINDCRFAYNSIIRILFLSMIYQTFLYLWVIDG